PQRQQSTTECSSQQVAKSERRKPRQINSKWCENRSIGNVHWLGCHQNGGGDEKSGERDNCSSSPVNQQSGATHDNRQGNQGRGFGIKAVKVSRIGRVGEHEQEGR